MFMALLAAAAVAQSPGLADPLAPAQTGQVQCYAPNEAQKTCASLASYTTNADGTYTNVAVILLSKSPLLVMESRTQVHLTNGAVCGAIHAEDLAAAKLSLNGQPLPEAQAQPILTQITTAMKDVIGHEICTIYEPSGTNLIARATMDGVPQPAQDQVVKWVAPADGYRVAP